MSCSLYGTEKNNAPFMPLSWITPLIHWSALILRNLLTIVCIIYKQKYRCYTVYGCFRCQYRSILNLK